MTTSDSFGIPLRQTEQELQAAKEAAEAGSRALHNLSTEWSEAHRARAEKIESELLSDTATAGADHRLLVRLAAREAALSERMSELQVQLLERANIAVNTPTWVGTIGTALKEVTATQVTIGRRVESLLSTAATIRAQRELAPARGRLRVA